MCDEHQHLPFTDFPRISGVLQCDLDTAAIDQPLQATLLMLGKLTREHTVNAGGCDARLSILDRPHLREADLRPVVVCSSPSE